MQNKLSKTMIFLLFFCNLELLENFYQKQSQSKFYGMFTRNLTLLSEHFLYTDNKTNKNI